MEPPENEIQKYNQQVRERLLAQLGENALEEFDADLLLMSRLVDGMVEIAYQTLQAGISRAGACAAIAPEINKIADKLPLLILGYVVHLATERIVEEQTKGLEAE
jgi:hypothetical protein